jgi:Double zinc ribbon
MLTLAYFGIESSGLNLVVDLLILFVVVLYLSLIYWTYADARRRIMDPMLVGCATAASLFPFVGTIVYMILRPPEYLEDVHERELEVQAAEARLHDLDHSLCPHCDYSIERDFVRCPSCLRKLKERCVSCSRPLDQAWTICPYCETEVAPAEPPRRTARRRRAVAADVEPGAAVEPEPELTSSRPETARARATRERREKRELAAPEVELDGLGDAQDTQATPVAASEPATGAARSTGRSSRASGRARPSS